MTNLLHLPQETVEELKTLQKSDREKMCGLVADLNDAQWPLRTLAQALGVSRTSALSYARKGRAQRLPDHTPPATAPHVPIDAPGSGVKPARIHLNIPPNQRQEFIDLYALAKTKTRWSNANSPEYKAATQFNDQLLTYKRRRIPLATIAKHLGVTRRALAQRIENLEV